MTDEEIEKKAEERFSKHWEEDYCYPSKSDLELYKDGYKDSATDTLKELLDILDKDFFFGDGIMCRKVISLTNLKKKTQNFLTRLPN